MTKAERENTIHCLKVMIDEEVCEECNLYGMTGADHCEADCIRSAIKVLEGESWTLCRERMPKPNEIRDMTRVYYLVQNKYGDMAVAHYNGHGWVQMYHGYLKDKVVAWMPLPEIVKLKGTEE